MKPPSPNLTPVEVLLDACWLRAVDECARKMGYSRDQFIQTACQELVEQVDERELERIYCERMQEVPEDLEWADAGAKLAGQVLPREEW